MSQPSIFDSEIALPDERLKRRENTLLGFAQRYARVHDQLRLLLNVGALSDWNRKFHGGKLTLCELVAEQYPLVIFHGDVGTGPHGDAYIAKRKSRSVIDAVTYKGDLVS